MLNNKKLLFHVGLLVLANKYIYIML
jgi:hypothetical protein